MWEILIYAFSMFMTGALLFLMVYSKMKYYNTLWKFALNNSGYRLLINLSISLIKLSIITLSDLECDYLNAQECCNRLNFWVRPKIVAQTIIVVGFLTDGNLWMALVNIPAAAWVIYEFVTVPRGNTGLFDPTEIHHRGQLKKHMRNFVIFTGWYLITFFFYLYFMILAILKGNPLETDAPQHVNKF